MLNLKRQNDQVSTSGQITLADIEEIRKKGFKTVVCNRPDAEAGGLHPQSKAVEEALKKVGLNFAYIPIEPNQISDIHASAFSGLLTKDLTPVLAYCASGARASTVAQRSRLMFKNNQNGSPVVDASIRTFDIIVVGAGAAGISVTASILRRRPTLSIALIDPSDVHCYQPAWTLVGAGEFNIDRATRPMSSVIPAGAIWIKQKVTRLMPLSKSVALADGTSLDYGQLIVCPGLRLAWERIEGLLAALGQNGVTSNYRRDLAPYTLQLVQELRGGKALFSQPGMPIKCAGAPQKAMYLSCDLWRRGGVLKNIDVEFDLAGPALFGVATFVPALMKYVERYKAKLVFNSTLVKVDGPSRTAWFDVKQPDGSVAREARQFDMLHAVPPQVSPDFVQVSNLADAAGWCEVDHATLQSPRYPDVFSLGDVCSAPNAKTVAAVRKQAVAVAENLLAQRDGKPLPRGYDGYGACPLTVERGKVVLAEFGYGGKLLPTFPFRPDVPRRSSWWLKRSVLPWVYWRLLLKGREWLTNVQKV